MQGVAHGGHCEEVVQGGGVAAVAEVGYGAEKVDLAGDMALEEDAEGL